jgi:hypothetical protein
MATAANAALIGARWAQTPDQKLFGTSGTVEIWLQLTGNESIISSVLMDFSKNNLAEQTNLFVDNYNTDRPGWGTDGQTGLLGPGTQASWGSAGNLTTDWIQPGAVGPQLMGTFDVTVLGLADGTTKPIFLNFHTAPLGVLDDTATPLVWDARYAAGGTDGMGYGGYIAYMNWGNPGWGTMDIAMVQFYPNPLLITKTPEPASMALVALGGFALLRRRR